MSALAAHSEAPMLLREDIEGVAHLTLNRPGQFNALSTAMLEALLAELDAIASDRSLRVVVLAGAGKAFCAGHDLKEMRANQVKAFQQALFALCSRVMMRIVSMPQRLPYRSMMSLASKPCRGSSVVRMTMVSRFF